jgi:hypothetical protein
MATAMFGFAGPAAMAARPPVEVVQTSASPPNWDQVYGGLEARRLAKGTQLTATISVNVSGLGVFCGNCEGPDREIFGAVGGRLYGVVQRAPRCAPEPPAPDGRRLAASVVSRAVGRQAGRDLTPGGWALRAVFPPGSLAKGTWRLCTWFRFDPSYRVSNSAAPDGLAPGLPDPSLGQWGTKGPYLSRGSVTIR